MIDSSNERLCPRRAYTRGTVAPLTCRPGTPPLVLHRDFRGDVCARPLVRLAHGVRDRVDPELPQSACPLGLARKVGRRKGQPAK